MIDQPGLLGPLVSLLCDDIVSNCHEDFSLVDLKLLQLSLGLLILEGGDAPLESEVLYVSLDEVFASLVRLKSAILENIKLHNFVHNWQPNIIKLAFVLFLTSRSLPLFLLFLLFYEICLDFGNDLSFPLLIFVVHTV